MISEQEMHVASKVRVAVVGLEFGRGFAAAFARHPDVEYVGLCDLNPDTLKEVGDRLSIARRHSSLDEVIASRDYDAVALFTAIPDHAQQAQRVLAAGKHCACAVPMATTLQDIHAIIDARRKANRVYMMMETSLYTPEMFFVQDLLNAGELGRIQFVQGVWFNNLENHPRYWHGIPPMHYITHPVSPLLKIAKAGAQSVCCLGSGTMRPQLQEVYGNPHPIQSAIFRLRGCAAAMQITSITIETALQNKETFDVFGSKQSFKWATFHDDKHALVRIHPALPGGPKSSPNTVMRFTPPSGNDRLPRTMREGLWGPAAHLVHEFVRAIVESRPSAIDVVEAATYTAPGLCAHESACANGKPVDVPEFR